MVSLGLLVLRIGVAGLMFVSHGWARFFRAFDYVFSGGPWPFVEIVDQIGFPAAGIFAVLSALSESVGALLVTIGWLTRWAALAIVIDMAVALFNEASKGDPIEMPALYFVAALTIAIAGAGRYAIDAWLRPSADTLESHERG